MNHFKVYKHTCPNGKVYIGITGQRVIKRWNNGHGYKGNVYFYRAITKYGWDKITHEVLFDNLTKDEAELKEIELIKEYKSNNNKYGYNLTNGGNCIGTHTEETKAKLSALRKGKLNPFYGKKHKPESIKRGALLRTGLKHTEETKAKISESRLGEKHWFYGKTFSDEHKRKLSLAHSGDKNHWYGTEGYWKDKQHSNETKEKMSEKQNKNKVSVVCINKETLEVIKKYDSLTAAYKDTGTDKSSIRQCCQGRCKTAGGYIWEYA
jgi:hypothetical protein